jgi:hypothetical protein
MPQEGKDRLTTVRIRLLPAGGIRDKILAEGGRNTGGNGKWVYPTFFIASSRKF